MDEKTRHITLDISLLSNDTLARVYHDLDKCGFETWKDINEVNNLLDSVTKISAHIMQHIVDNNERAFYDFMLAVGRDMKR